MLFDGARALIIGDYKRPKTGKYANQLGPWSKLVSANSINPTSVFMKSIFVAFGLIGIFISTSFALNYSWAWQALLIFNC
jgi:sensor histidine kinase YesM